MQLGKMPVLWMSFGRSAAFISTACPMTHRHALLTSLPSLDAAACCSCACACCCSMAS